VPVRLGRDLQVRGGRTDYLRARWRDVPGLGAALEPLTEQSSSALHSVCNSDALLAAGPQAVYRCGDLVDAVLLDALD
jgi:molybdopterin biosynthesis enzyme